MAGKSKILVIDQDSGLADIAHEAAESSSWEISLVSGSAEGINKAMNENFDLIILGYLEPRGKAFILHKQLKENRKTQDIPQVIVDAAPEERTSKGWLKSQGMKMIAEDYLCQPITPEELVQSVEQVLMKEGVAGTL